MALTSSSCGSPWETANAFGTNSVASLPRCDFGSSGSGAERARSRANSRFSSKTVCTSASESWKTKPPGTRLGCVPSVPPTARAGAAGQLHGVGLRAVDLQRVVGDVAVDGVELGGQVRVVARDRRVALVTAGERLHDRVVGRLRLDLPALGVQDQLAVGVVVDHELRLQAVHQRAVRGDLGLGARRRAAVGLGRGVVRRALRVEAPLRRPVAVRVDAVAVRDRAVAVVVAQGLAPQARAVGDERVVVAVGVHDRGEPQLGRREDLRDAGGRVVLVREHVLEQPPVGLHRDPLARMLGGVVEDDRLGALRACSPASFVTRKAASCWPRRDLPYGTRSTTSGFALRLLQVPLSQRQQRRRAVGRARRRVQVPRPEDVEPVRRVLQRVRRRDLLVGLVAGERLDGDVLRLELRRLRWRGDDQVAVLLGVLRLAHVVAGAGEGFRIGALAAHDELLEHLGGLRCRLRGRRDHECDERRHGGAECSVRLGAHPMRHELAGGVGSTRRAQAARSPQALSITYSQLPSGCRRATSAVVAPSLAGLPSGIVPPVSAQRFAR